jgi:regulatory protein
LANSGAARALEFAYRYLNRRERTTDEVRRHLEAKGVQTALADQALAALTEQGVLDDARFVRLFVQDKRELEQWGAERIRRGLVARGVDRDLVEDVLAEAAEQAGAKTIADGGSDCEARPETELDRALQLLRRRFSIPPRDRRERDRALGILIRKGYDPELAVDALAVYRRDRG